MKMRSLYNQVSWHRMSDRSGDLVYCTSAIACDDRTYRIVVLVHQNEGKNFQSLKVPLTSPKEWRCLPTFFSK